MGFFDNITKKEKSTKTAPRPKLRPANFGSGTKERQGTGGKDKAAGEAKPKYDTTASGWNDQVAKFNAKGGINNDGKFGYGYVDTQTGIEVPWYIDMINGGGANAAGDTFVSPFEGTAMGLPAQMATGALNKMNVAPYGSNRPRYFMPMEAARVDAEGKPVQVDLGPASTGGGVGGGSSTVTPAPNILGIGDFTVNQRPRTNMFDDEEVQLPSEVGMGAPAYTPHSSMGMPPVPQVAGPIMAGHNLPPIQGVGPSEQQLRERAIQTYGDLFLGLSPTGQQAIMRGIAQGMANAN